MLVVVAGAALKQLAAEQAVVAEVVRGVLAHKMVLLVQQTEAAEAGVHQILAHLNKAVELAVLGLLFLDTLTYTQSQLALD